MWLTETFKVGNHNMTNSEPFTLSMNNFTISKLKGKFLYNTHLIENTLTM